MEQSSLSPDVAILVCILDQVWVMSRLHKMEDKEQEEKVSYVFVELWNEILQQQSVTQEAFQTYHFD